MSTRCEGLTATNLRGHPYYVGKTKHVKLLQGDVGVGDRQGSRSVFLLLFVRLSVDVTYFLPLHDYYLAALVRYIKDNSDSKTNFEPESSHSVGWCEYKLAP